MCASVWAQSTHRGSSAGLLRGTTTVWRGRVSLDKHGSCLAMLLRDIATTLDVDGIRLYSGPRIASFRLGRD